MSFDGTECQATEVSKMSTSKDTRRDHGAVCTLIIGVLVIIWYGSSSDTWEGSPGRQNYELSILDTNKPHSSTCFMYLKLVEFKSLWTQSVEWGFCSDENQQNPSCSEDNHHHIRVHDSKFECWKSTKINRPRLNCSETIAVSTVSETSIGLVQYQLLFQILFSSVQSWHIPIGASTNEASISTKRPTVWGVLVSHLWQVYKFLTRGQVTIIVLLNMWLELLHSTFTKSPT